MTRKRCTGKAPAERRRRAMQLYLAEFSQEEIADKLGMHRSVVCRDLQSVRDAWRSGDSPDLEEARFPQTAIRKRGQAPYTLYEVEARYTTSGSQAPFQVGHCAPRRRPHPGTKGGSTTRWSMDTAPA
ncbi:MAG: terminase gpP N-terminus-related DNA-binding protein [Thermoguttaceae bacterium]